MTTEERVTDVETAEQLLARAVKALDEAGRQWHDAMRYAREAGMTHEAIGGIVGLTRQRVWQILREQQ